MHWCPRPRRGSRRDPGLPARRRRRTHDRPEREPDPARSHRGARRAGRPRRREPGHQHRHRLLGQVGHPGELGRLLDPRHLDSNNPTTVGRAFCDGNQGDVIVWKNIVVRSWNTPAGTPGAFGAGECGGQPVPGWEGVHIFNISDKAKPKLVASVRPLRLAHEHTCPGQGERPCSSTAARPPIRRWTRIRLRRAMDRHHRGSLWGARETRATFGRSRRSTRAMTSASSSVTRSRRPARAARASASSASAARTAARSRIPSSSTTSTIPGVTIGHSAACSANGDVLIFGHEPGGGVAPECEATDPAPTGALLLRHGHGAMLGT